jgi:LacI family transcriptional regulator
MAKTSKFDKASKTAHVMLGLPTDVFFTREILLGIFRQVHSARPWNFINQSKTIDEADLDQFPPDAPHPGMICVAWSDKVIKSVARSGIPAVNVVETATNSIVPSVLPDNYECGCVAARYFLERQFVNFAVADLQGHPYSDLRAKGFHEELKRHGFTAGSINTSDTAWPKHSLEGWPKLENFLREMPLPLALFATNDKAALYVINTCLHAGISVPGEVAVLGVDNDEICCELSPVPISSVIIPWRRIGMEAAALLDSMLDGKPKPAEPVRIPPSGVFSRRSTEMVAVGDPIVARALTFIMANAFQPISVSDVVAATGASRRYIERRFLKVTGFSPKQTITTVRINQVKKYLADNELSLAEISEKTGFSDAKALVSVFHKKTGLTISAYRAKILNRTSARTASGSTVVLPVPPGKAMLKKSTGSKR